MSIQIDEARCTGCGRCVEVCPGNLLRLNERQHAGMARPQDCWGCTACLKECRSGALRYYLGADLGGRGSTMTVTEKQGISFWHVLRPDGSTITLEVNKNESNQY